MFDFEGVGRRARVGRAGVADLLGAIVAPVGRCTEEVPLALDAVLGGHDLVAVPRDEEPKENVED